MVDSNLRIIDSGRRALRGLARRLLPHAARVEVARLRRAPAWWLEGPSMARIERIEPARFAHPLARHRTPLHRAGTADSAAQAAKTHNVTRAARQLDGVVVQPEQRFSYHHSVGRPSRRRGFVEGLELRNGQPARGVGGGCCQVSNLIYLLALRAGMTIVERHRHTLDLFPDAGRTVPFGCGATVFYNYADLRFDNPLDQAVRIALQIEGGHLVGEIRTDQSPGFDVEIYEVDHRFFQLDGAWFRENRIRRRFRDARGEILGDEEIAHNRGRVLYTPAAEAVS